MYRKGITTATRCLKSTSRGQRGQASLIYALGLALLTFVFITVLDVGLVEAAHQRLAGYAEQTAQAGADAAIMLDGFGTGERSAPLLNPMLATQQAQLFFQALALGPTYTLTILQATPTVLTVQVSAKQEVFLWPGPVALSEQASATPQADTL
jgi:hypothetical protein